MSGPADISQSVDRAVVVNIRYSCGTYVARGGGKNASCTRSAAAALCVLADKLGFGESYTVADYETVTPSHHRCTITPKEPHA